MHTRNHIPLAIVVLILTLVPCSSPVTAQNTLIAQEKLQTAQAFDATMTSISRLAQTPILVEGYPRNPVGLIEKSNSIVSDTKATIKMVAEKNDYTVETASGCYILRKKYSTPLDLPCITLPEYRDSLELIRRAIRQFSPVLLPPPEPSDPKKRRDPDSYRMIQVYERLKDHPDRKRGDGYIALSEAGPEVKKLLRQSWASGALGTVADEIEAALRYLTDLEVVVVSQEARIPLVAKRKDGGREFLSEFNEGRVLPSAAPRMVPRQTLGDLATKWNEAGAKKRIVIHPSLEQKPLTAYGIEFAAPEKMARATATLFQLGAVENETEIHITARRRPLPTRMTAISEYIRAVLPYPLTRILFSEYQTGTDKGVDGGFSAKSTDTALRDGAWFHLAGAYQRERAKIDTLDIPLTEFSPQEQIAFALCVTRLSALYQPSRTGFELDEEIERGGVMIKIMEYQNENGETRISIVFDYPRRTGGNPGYQTGYGVSNLLPP